MSWKRGKSYSADLAERVVGAVDGGMAVREVAPLFRVSISYIYKAQKRHLLTGSAGPRPRPGRPGCKLSGHEDALQTHMEATPDLTISELQAWVRAVFGITISRGAMWNALDRLGLTFKKNRSSALSLAKTCSMGLRSGE